MTHAAGPVPRKAAAARPRSFVLALTAASLLLLLGGAWNLHTAARFWPAAHDHLPLPGLMLWVSCAALVSSLAGSMLGAGLAAVAYMSRRNTRLAWILGFFAGFDLCVVMTLGVLPHVI